jgi:hypothetical protein
MRTKSRTDTPTVPTQRQGRGSGQPQKVEPTPAPDHRVRNITLLVSTAVVVVGAVLALWFAIFAGEDTPQAPTSPNTISQGTDADHPNFLRKTQEEPLGPEGDGSDTRLYNQAP